MMYTVVLAASNRMFIHSREGERGREREREREFEGRKEFEGRGEDQVSIEVKKIHMQLAAVI